MVAMTSATSRRTSEPWARCRAPGAIDEPLALDLRDGSRPVGGRGLLGQPDQRQRAGRDAHPDRKSTRLNSSHSQISYAVFCLKKTKHCKPQYPTLSAA